MLTAVFWKDTIERAVKTFCQVLATLIGAGATNIVLLNWPDMLGVSATAALLSILTSIVSSSARGDRESASLVEEKPNSTAYEYPPKHP